MKTWTDTLLFSEAVEAFVAHHKLIELEDKARAFAAATQQRMVEIYLLWYSSAGISKLIPEQDAQ